MQLKCAREAKLGAGPNVLKSDKFEFSGWQEMRLSIVQAVKVMRGKVKMSIENNA